MKFGRKVGNRRSIRNEDLFLEITMILGEKRQIRDQNHIFLENIQFWKSLPRAPNFEYPPLIIATQSTTPYIRIKTKN